MKNDRRAPLARPPAAPPGPLPDASQLLQFVMDGAADGVFVAEATSKRLHLVNPALCTLLGYTREELLALQLADVMPDDPPPLAADAGQRIACSDEDKNRVTLLRKDGGRLRAMQRSSLLQRDGQQWLAGVLHDLSLSERATEAERLANHDSLTTLYNHRTFQQLLGKELDRAQRQGTPLSLLMIDIDHFKRINDSYGHQAGDAVLRQLAMLLLEGARYIDLVCRYGGEELVVVLPATGTDAALHVAERLRTQVAQTEFSCSSGKWQSLTVSIGVASYPLHAQTQGAFIEAADNAMYCAKKRGRNCSVVCEEPGFTGEGS